jgi:hypothetical protein
LHRHLKLFLEYYHGTRTHLWLEKDSPGGRSAARVGACGSRGAGWPGYIIGTNVAPPKPRRDAEWSHRNSPLVQIHRGAVSPTRPRGFRSPV